MLEAMERVRPARYPNLQFYVWMTNVPFKIIHFYRDVPSVDDRLYYLSFGLFGGFRTTQEFFTHLETSPLLQFLPIILGTRDHWALWLGGGGGWLAYDTYILTRDICL